MYEEKHPKIHRDPTFNFAAFQTFSNNILNENSILYEPEIFYHFSCVMFTYERYLLERIDVFKFKK